MNEIIQLSIRTLLNDVDYLIPMYQRNYAWEEGEITQLIQDIIDYLPGHGEVAQNYYIGTLVVFEDKERKPRMFEVIDGQQRLTTLSLLASCLKNDRLADLSWYQHLRIHFESRQKSQKTFAGIFAGHFDLDRADALAVEDLNAEILNGYRLIQRILPQKIAENRRSMNEFVDFLFERVQIMRVKVPDDTDLNHYFEIMNNRGEQLEQHEVLKAKMLEVLNDIVDPDERQRSQRCLQVVWEACANMERYVQMGFAPDFRNAIFGSEDWKSFNISSFAELQNVFRAPANPASAGSSTQSLSEIINKPQREKDSAAAGDEAPERFNTVINFANFLLQVLRVETGTDIPLDDKRLVSTFETQILKKSDAIARVQRFIFALLRCKYLLDHYVIKREFIAGSDRWSLKSLKYSRSVDKGAKADYVNTFGDDEAGVNRSILMILSAFHVSTPTLVYKHWLSGVLNYLFLSSGTIDSRPYLFYLESLAKAFVFDNFLAIDGLKKEYFEIVFHNGGACRTGPGDLSRVHLDQMLVFGKIKNNLVFNFLDYLLWQRYKDTDGLVRSYEFSFRSSVEHYYPRQPMPGHDRLPAAALDSFGNLCLISHSKNSRLSNSLPEAKKEHYKAGPIDSVKQFLMMKSVRWDAAAIAEHDREMKQILLGSLENSASTEHGRA